MREEFERLVNMLRGAINVLPNSREKSLAITKLDECYLWTAVAINTMEAHKNQEEKENDEQ